MLHAVDFICFRAFYRHPSGKNYVVPNEMMKVGLVCVGQYPDNQEWHRCVILELTDESAKVNFPHLQRYW